MDKINDSKSFSIENGVVFLPRDFAESTRILTALIETGALPKDLQLPKEKEEEVTTLERISGSFKIIETRDSKGKLHSVNGEPSIRKFYIKTNALVKESWHNHDVLHRENDLPAIVEYDQELGTVSYESWYVNGVNCRADNKPRTIRYHHVIKHQVYEEYYRDHSEGLKRIEYTIYGTVFSKTYDPKDDNPTYKRYKDDGTLDMQSWRNYNGDMHRPLDKGPAIIYYKNNLMSAYAYYLNGKLIEGLILE